MKILRILGKRGRVTIPYEIRQEVGFKYNDVLSFVQADNNTVIVRREKICDESCPMYNEYNQPANTNSKVTRLLDGLTAEEQRTALVHLSVRWAEKETVGAGKGAENNSASVRESGAGSACWAMQQNGGAANV